MDIHLGNKVKKMLVRTLSNGSVIKMMLLRNYDTIPELKQELDMIILLLILAGGLFREELDMITLHKQLWNDNHPSINNQR